jgi:hypothetical protein
MEQVYGKRVRPVRRHRQPVRTKRRSARAVAIGLVILAVLLSVSTLAILKSETGWLHTVSTFATRVIRGREDPAPVEYFNAGLENWVSATVHSTGAPLRFGEGEWSLNSLGAEPGALRLWKESLDLSDYDFSFHARMKVKAIGWAFRATDAGTFYGMKITVAGPGHELISRLEHFARVRGKEVSRNSMPLPMMLNEGADCHVQVRVRGSRFTTSIDGQVVEMWNDQRLKSGGIGLFSEAGESSTISWVKVVERGSLAGRVAGYFSLAAP